MMNNDNRIELLDRIIDEYNVDAVIDVVLQACHTFNIESYRIREFVTKEKISHLCLLKLIIQNQILNN